MLKKENNKSRVKVAISSETPENFNLQSLPCNSSEWHLLVRTWIQTTAQKLGQRGNARSLFS